MIFWSQVMFLTTQYRAALKFLKLFGAIDHLGSGDDIYN